ncbi:sushi, nidogen and EGF-like domain-containing protein 1 [Ruditapes philippinarum]|uniref:sushi, nidogen and EGF-like domain-containing protein 1 n=1 Tax=Ruditapes philippinarum TaxID=129788 RepID=UPI00295AC15F|nr:sushi, nidogen and EGF-like domain-containing protein 1 [Ruditapes philippinarum]
MDIQRYSDIFIYFNLVLRVYETVLIGDAVDETSRYVPPSFVDQCPPQDLSQSYTVPPGRNYVTIKWTEPIAIDQFGNKLRIEQVQGVKNGGQFTGSIDFERHHIVYIATDSNGLKDNCYFEIYVQIPECPSLVIDNGQYRCSEGSSPRSSCLFSCNKGYIVNKAGNITCDYTPDSVQAIPTWSDSRQCEIVNCSQPTVPENADISCTKSDNSYLSVCFIQCRQGYTPSGPLYMMCMADGTWSRSTLCLKNVAFEQQCSSQQCNGHTCILGVNQEIQCNCSNGWSGQTCEIPPNYCGDNVCMNNASCVNQYFWYNCTCPQYYSGLLCQISPVNGNWSDWTAWSSCSRSCGSGNQTRFRQCDSPSPGPGGRPCEGDEFDGKPCNLSKCKVCPPLKKYNSSLSNYSCEIYDNYGQEKCQTVCENGTILLPQFKQFDEILCGWPTNNEWIPGNIQPTCVAPVPPKGLRLEASISYEKRIPNDKEDVFKEEVLDHLGPTDCFTTTKIKCGASLTFSSISSQTGSIISKLTVNFQITLDTVIRKRSTAFVATDEDSSLDDARHVLEMTADYVKNFTADIFDIRLGETEFISDKKSLNISASIDCGEGMVPNNGSCAVCSKGCYITNEKCELCGKGFYQEQPGQTECIPCPVGYTTIMPGAIYPYECSKPAVNTLDTVSKCTIL